MSEKNETIEKVVADKIAQQAAKVEALKKAHPKGVWQINNADASKVAYLRTPTRDEISYASTFLPNDQLGYAAAILENCFLEGDEAFKTDDKLFLAIVPQIDDIIEVEEVALKKL